MSVFTLYIFLFVDCNEGASGTDETMISKEKEYECVICGQMTASEEDRPVGMVVLLQATSGNFSLIYLFLYLVLFFKNCYFHSWSFFD